MSRINMLNVGYHEEKAGFEYKECVPLFTETPEESELIVYGFVREFNDYISIPSDIISLCQRFHFVDIDGFKPMRTLNEWGDQIYTKAYRNKNLLLAEKLAVYYVQHMQKHKAIFYNALAMNYEMMKLTKKAEYHYKQAITDDPKSETYRWNYADLLQQQARYLEAIQVFKQAIKLNGNKLILHYSLAQCYEAMNGDDFNGCAQEQYRLLGTKKVTHPDNGLNFLMNAVGFGKLGNKFACKESYKKYKKMMDIDKVKTATKYGIMLFELGKYEESMEFLQKAIKIHRDTSITYFYCGLIMKENKQYVKAKSYFEKALDLSEKYPQCEMALDQVNQIMMHDK